jgi:hypothetical protein
MEALLVVQSHRAQGGTDGSSTRGEDRSHQEGAKSRIIGVGRVRIYSSPLLAETGDERTLSLSLANG